MINVKNKKDKVKRKRVGNVRTTEKTRKKGGNVSQVVNVYVTKGGGGRRKAPARSRPSFLQSQPQLFTANYDNTLLNQIQPIQDKFIKVINTNNDLLNKLLIKQRTADSSIQTDTLTNDKLFISEAQTQTPPIPTFRPADTQTEPIFLTSTDTQTEPLQNRVIETQTEPTFLTSTDTQTEPTFLTSTDTQTPPLQNVISTQTPPLQNVISTQTTPTFLTSQGTQSEPLQNRVIETQTEPTFLTSTDTQTEPTFLTSTDTQTEPTFLTSTDTQTEPILFQPVDTQSDTSSFIDTDRQVTSDIELQEYINYLQSKDKPELDEAKDEALQTQLTIAINDLEDIENRILELGGEIFKGTKPKKLKTINKKIKKYEEEEAKLLSQLRRDDDPEQELSDLITKDIEEQRQADPRQAEQDDLTTQLIDLKQRAKANDITLKRGGIPLSEEGKRKQIRYYSEQISIKNRATSI